MTTETTNPDALADLDEARTILAETLGGDAELTADGADALLRLTGMQTKGRFKIGDSLNCELADSMRRKAGNLLNTASALAGERPVRLHHRSTGTYLIGFDAIEDVSLEVWADSEAEAIQKALAAVALLRATGAADEEPASTETETEAA